MFLRTPTRTRGLVVIALLLGSAACGGEGGQTGEMARQRVEPAGRPASPLADSLRRRRNAMLAKRPDTLGMRADSGRILGSPSAKVWVIVTSDFQCAACREFALNAIPLLRKEFVDKGLVRLAFVNNPQEQHFNARFAALAALCASAAGRFWEMHDSLFASQRLWERTPDPRPYFDSLAVAAGVPPELQAYCSSQNRMLLRLASDIEQSRQSAVTDVPAVFVGDRRLRQNEFTPGGLRRAVLTALGER